MCVFTLLVCQEMAYIYCYLLIWIWYIDVCICALELDLCQNWHGRFLLCISSAVRLNRHRRVCPSIYSSRCYI